MSSVLFLAHRSRARVNARVLVRRKKDERPKMGSEGEEGTEGAELRKRVKRWITREEDGKRKRHVKERGKQIARGRFARERAHARWKSEVEGGGYIVAALARAKRIGEDRTRWAARKRGRDIGRWEQDRWTDAWKARTNLFALFGGRDRAPARIDSTPSFRY